MAIFFMILYGCAVVGVTIYLLVLATRFVGAHERVAGALERLAHSQRREER